MQCEFFLHFSQELQYRRTKKLITVGPNSGGMHWTESGHSKGRQIPAAGMCPTCAGQRRGLSTAAPSLSSALLPEHGGRSKAKNAARQWLSAFWMQLPHGPLTFSYLFEEWAVVILCTCKRIACLFVPRQELLHKQVEPTSLKQPFILKNCKRSSFLCT